MRLTLDSVQEFVVGLPPGLPDNPRDFIISTGGDKSNLAEVLGRSGLTGTNTDNYYVEIYPLRHYEIAPESRPQQYFSRSDDALSSGVSPRYWDDQRYIKQLVESGELPLLGNGWSFVVDTRPAGEEDRVVPPRRYTQYFRTKQIPIAAEGHKYRDHDIGHVSSYQNMFNNASFADLVVTAATNADNLDEEHCVTFTNAINSFGDCTRNLESGRGHVSDVLGSGRCLRELFELAYPDEDEQTRTDQFRLLWIELGMVGYDYEAECLRKARNKSYERVVPADDEELARIALLNRRQRYQ